MEKTQFKISRTKKEWDKFKKMMLDPRFDEDGILYIYKATVLEDPDDPIKIEGIGCTEGPNEVDLWGQ